MALDFLKNMSSTITALSNLSRRNEKDPMEVENLALRNLKLQRELLEPTATEREKKQQSIDMQKNIFSNLKDLSLDTRVPQATRDYYGKLLEYQFFGLPDEYREILKPLTASTPLDENEQKKLFFDKHYGSMAPEMPLNETGRPLERNADNEVLWAKYELEASEFNYRRNLFLYGKDFADAEKPPRFIQAIPYIGEGENRRSGDYWYRDPATQQIMNVPSSIGLTSQKDLDKWGWTMARVRSTGHIPTAEPIQATYGSNKVQITPVMDMITGENRQDVQFYGSTDEALKTMPKDLLTALGEVGRGTDFDDAKVSGSVSNIMRILTEYKKTYEGKETTASLNNLNAQLHSLYPDIQGYRVVLGPKDKSSSWWRNALNIPGTEFSIIPATGTITVYDQNGNQGKLYTDEKTGKAHSGSGQELPAAKGAKEGDTIAAITFDEPTGETVGDILVTAVDSLANGSLAPDREEVQRAVAEAISMREGDRAAKAIGKVAGKLAKEFGYSTAYWYNILIGDPGKFLGKQVEEGINKLLNLEIREKKK